MDLCLLTIESQIKGLIYLQLWSKVSLETHYQHGMCTEELNLLQLKHSSVQKREAKFLRTQIKCTYLVHKAIKLLLYHILLKIQSKDNQIECCTKINQHNHWSQRGTTL